MNYRERFEKTMKHQNVDRVPFDIAGTALSGFDANDTIIRLREILGFIEKYDHWYPNCDERILRYLDIDFRNVGDVLEAESELTCKLSENSYNDCWGVTRTFTGLYWEITDSPLKGASIEDLKNYPWPNPEKLNIAQLDDFTELAKKLFTETDKVVCATHPVYGVFELGCWMCGFDDFLLKMALEPDFVLRFFDIIMDYQKTVIETYYGLIGDYIHLTTSGDDFGTQTGTFFAPKMFEELIKPYYKERITNTKQYTDGYFFHHSCGSVHSLIPHLIDAGVDILNPIQPGAFKMEPERLKSDFGSELTFWGGIDTQRVLPSGNPDEVKAEVERVLDIMSPQSGFILAPAHNIQIDVPAENIIALFDAGIEYFS